MTISAAVAPPSQLRLAGDLHHYTRHVPFSGKKLAPGMSTVKNTSETPVLIISGGGDVVSTVHFHRLRKRISIQKST